MNPKPSDQSPEGRAPDGGADDTLGAQLRRAREERGLSLRDISDHTRISMRHLEAIEVDDFKALPGGIFNRSFIKAYAKQVRFDEHAALEGYARIVRGHGGDVSDETSPLPTRARVYLDGDTTHPPWLNIFLSALIVGILVLGVYAVLHWYKRTGTDAAERTAVNPVAPTVNAVPQPTPQATAAPVGFTVRVRAQGEDVWFRPIVDDAAQPDITLRIDQTREFSPQQRFRLQYSPSKTRALEVSINGQVAKAPKPDSKNGIAEWAITKDNYTQFLPQ
ncbi:MAG: helix-turn-helix domain-containing protein [Pyrinomonadaceae bacterium]|nr:helix-turn-helix domain-containing protein [Pyrinomonadaceae bacterium]